VAQPRYLPQQFTSGQVLIRFGVRMIILAVFAAFGSIGFTKSLATLVAMAIVFSTVLAVMKREEPFGKVLNHWDETVAYTAVFSLVSIFIQAAPA
jgi:hypothetical protein